jgi:nucleoid-associated protein EbfC
VLSDKIENSRIFAEAADARASGKQDAVEHGGRCRRKRCICVYCQAIPAGHMDSVPQCCDGHLGPRAPEDIDRSHGLNLLKSVRENDKYSGHGHGALNTGKPEISRIFSKTPRYLPGEVQPRPLMAGVGKLLKQAQKMQRSIETLQADLDAREIEVTAGGGAVKIKVSISGKFRSLTLDPDFLKEDPTLVSDTVLAAIQDAEKQAKILNDSEMQKVTSAFQMPGIF